MNRENGRVLMPRSSSPDPVFVDKMPRVVEQESPGMLESSLSPVGLVTFQGCIIPPLTPQQDFPPQDSPTAPSPEPGEQHAQDTAPWRGTAKDKHWLLDNSTRVNQRLHETLHSKQEEIESLQERNLHLRELASRAKHLAAVLEKLMTVRDPGLQEPTTPPCDTASSSPCKRQRLSEEAESVSSGSVDDILRDISTRCNAVLHRGGGSGGGGVPQDSGHIRMYGAFAGIQTSVAIGSKGASAGGSDADAGDSSFRTSIQDHCTIKTQVFPHGHAFTSRTQIGGYRFRWVPNQS
ncbi:hypothetical protein CRUP_009142 [Coryphaenoides rupestris]|nr:hypothetical protein CRUP_009142 [Coryphaenoides rupestris]